MVEVTALVTIHGKYVVVELRQVLLGVIQVLFK